eukprot:768161-Hanusia_phi.AAC.3
MPNLDFWKEVSRNGSIAISLNNKRPGSFRRLQHVAVCQKQKIWGSLSECRSWNEEKERTIKTIKAKCHFDNESPLRVRVEYKASILALASADRQIQIVVELLLRGDASFVQGFTAHCQLQIPSNEILTSRCIGPGRSRRISTLALRLQQITRTHCQHCSTCACN